MTNLYLDFESYSEVDLKRHGSDVYARHESTRALMLGWSIDDGPSHVWDITAHQPGVRINDELLAAYSDPNVLKIAHNAPFDMAIFEHVMKWPVAPREWRCSQVLAYSMGFTGRLGPILQAVGFDADTQKDKDGHRLIMRFCKRQPKNHNTQIWTRDNSPVDWKKFLAYCRQDIVTLRALWQRLIPYNSMDNYEWGLWHMDREINRRGLPVDRPLVHAAVELMASEKVRLSEALKAYTGLEKATPQPLLAWINTQRTFMGEPPLLNLQKGTKQQAHDTTESPRIKEALRMSLLIAQASSGSKWNALLNRSHEGVIRDTLQFAGAGRTRRWAGRGLQLQNLKWSPKNMDELIGRIRLGVADMGDITSCIRGSILAPPGMKLVVSDLSSIESRVVGWLTTCKRLNKIFQEGGDAYIDLAAEIFNTPHTTISKEQRTFAKPAALGCFGESTRLLTDTGWKCILDITLSNKLWDGLKWVNHQGVFFSGNKKVINQLGVQATPDHRILRGLDQWTTWQDLGDLKILRETCSVVGLLWKESEGSGSANVLVARLPGSGAATLKGGCQPGVMPVEVESRESPSLLHLNWVSRIKTLFDYPIGIMHNIVDAIIHHVRALNSTEREALNVGLPILPKQFATLSLLTGGTTRLWRLIGLIITGITRRVISSLWIGPQTQTIPASTALYSMKELDILQHSSGLDSPQNTGTFGALAGRLRRGFLLNKLLPTNLDAVVPTFDVLNCGDLNRFTILTDAGPMIAHNCAYQLGGKGLKMYADSFGVEMSEKVAQKHVDAFRGIYPEIPGFWYWLKDVIFFILDRGPGPAIEGYGLSIFLQGEYLRIRLPSGRCLNYFKPAMQMKPAPWDRGKLIPNFTYMGTDLRTTQWCRISAHMGGVCENCIAEGTEVLTESGWKPIEDITLSDLIHDGVEFVTHKGILYKSRQTCIEVDGVSMTTDHEVLSHDSTWKTASRIQRPYRPNIRIIDRLRIFRKKSMAICLRMWQRSNSFKWGDYSPSRRLAQLWLQNGRATTQTKKSRPISDTYISRVAIDEVSMHSTYPLRMGSIWGARRSCLCRVARQFRSFLQGHGALLFKRLNVEEAGQLPRIFQRELCMEIPQTSGQQHEEERTDSNAKGSHEYLTGRRRISNRKDNPSLPTTPRMASRQTIHQSRCPQPRVYDILECGPRHRFVVRGEQDAFIVHNCVQAIARDIMATWLSRVDAMRNIDIIGHVHDEVITLVPETMADLALDHINQAIRMNPEPWYLGLPLNAEGYTSNRYRKD